MRRERIDLRYLGQFPNPDSLPPNSNENAYGPDGLNDIITKNGDRKSSAY